MIPIIHRQCGQVAFYADRYAVPAGTVIKAAWFTLVGGGHPTLHTAMKCGSCHAHIALRPAMLNWPTCEPDLQVGAGL